MNEIVGYFMAFMGVILVLALAGGIVAVTIGAVNTALVSANVTAPSWYSSSITAAGGAISLMASFLSILALAAIGGLAFMYMFRMGIFGGEGRRE